MVLDTVELHADITGLSLGEGHAYKVEAGDKSGNWTADGPQIDIAGAPSSPKAPPLDLTVATRACEAAAFLYTGADPVQQEVAPGSLRCEATALLRGHVFSESGQGLSGVRVSIHEHPEWGFTYTQGDGQFDFVVEAGQHIVEFTRDGHFPAHRLVTLAPQDWGHSPDVVLKKPDVAVTEIALVHGGMHVSTPQTDTDGTRRTWLYFPPGTEASLRMPDDRRQPVSTVHVRASEYTVGPRGEAMMPADLPPTTNYTFATELSVDEAIAAGADGVEFSQPVTYFVNNFLGLPPGTAVPVGSYDRKQGRWIADHDARVITLVSVTDGRADFDVDGDGKVDTLPDITDSERVEAAKAFAVGTQMWRGIVRHFSTSDHNYTQRCTSRCETPQIHPDGNEPVCPSCSRPGSDIDVHNLTVGEDFAIAGTPFYLRYQSDRAVKPGKGRAFTLKLPWVGGTAPLQGDVLDAHLSVGVAGQWWEKTHDGKPAPGESETFVWDGKDAWGRVVQGPMPVTVKLGYRNRGERGTPTLADFNFLETGGESFSSRSSGRGGVVVERTWQGQLGTWFSNGVALGGLTLSILHNYVPSAGKLYRGDGSLVQSDALGATLDVLVGGGASATEGARGPETKVFLPTRLAFAPDGALYFNDGANLVKRLAPDGTVHTVAGAAGGGVEGDGVPALNARLRDISGIVVDRQRNLYIADIAQHRVYHVDPSGIIRPFAGSGVQGYSGDGGDALQAKLKFPAGLAVSSDGDVYFLCSNGANEQVLRRVRGGVITTVAGGGSGGGSQPDGVRALQAKLFTGSESHLALGTDGSLYFSEPILRTVRRLGPDGKIYQVAGVLNSGGFAGDNGPATAALLNSPRGVAVASDGSIYIGDALNHRVRRVRPDGNIETVAGNGTRTFGAATPGMPALRSSLHEPSGLLLLPDGTLVVAERGGARVRSLRASQAALAGPNTLILPNEDGDELYVFDHGGKHLKTLDLMTKALKYEFKYATNGILESIVDGFGNATTVLRDASGAPLGIKSPDGLVTTLKLDADGRVAAVVNPNNEATRLAYGDDGLLSSVTDAKGNASVFKFDDSGKLMKDTNAAGGSQTLSYTGPSNSINPQGGGVTRLPATSTVTTAEGRITGYQVLRTGAFDGRANSFPDGTLSTFTRGSDGSSELVSTDATEVHRQLAADSRFGMALAVPESVNTKTPSGLQRIVTTSRTVTLANAADALSDTKVEEVRLVNGKAWKRSWDSPTRTLTTTSPLGRQSAVRYDPHGQIIEILGPGVLPVTVSYDPRGRPTQLAQGPRTTTLDWNPSGFLASTTNALGHVAKLDYDKVGRPTKVTRPDGKLLQLGYDAVGNLSKLTPPERPEHGFTYNPISLLSTYQPPSLPGVGHESYAYDLDGALKSIAHPDGTESRYTRDSGGRLNKLTAPWGAYDFAYDKRTGQLTSASHLGQSLAWTYDGFLTTTEVATGAVRGSVGYSYDNNFRLSSLSVNGSIVMYSYDDDDLLTKAGDLSLSRNLTTGQLAGATLGIVTSRWSYDPHGDLAATTATGSGATIFQESLTRDAIGRITAKTETIQGKTTTWTYNYDMAGRLQQVTKDGVISGTYMFDANGNRTLAKGVVATFDAQDRMLTAGSLQFTYDAFGSLLEKRDISTTPHQVTRYQYDGNGGLRRATLPDGTALAYIVDARDRRVAKLRNGLLEKRWLYDGQLRIVAELDNVGSVTSRFIYGTSSNSPDYFERAGATYRIVHDSLGSVRLVVNTATATLAQRIDYDEWGNAIADSTPGFQPFGFAGGIYDADLKFVRFGARDYDAQQGRWTSRDLMGFNSGVVGLYVYAFNDPIQFIDITGLAPTRPTRMEQRDCKQLHDYIVKQNAELEKRVKEIKQNKRRRNLPFCDLGPPENSVAGHWAIIVGIHFQRNLAMILYDAKGCGGPPPPALPLPIPFPLPFPIPVPIPV